MAIATRDEWLAARKDLLRAEKELTRHNDEVRRQRLELPWLPVETEYTFATNDGPKTLAELFDGRSQLLVYHFMLGPNTPDGCPGCTFSTDAYDRTWEHLAHHDVTFVLASRASLAEINAYKERMGWTIPWVSSAGTGFNEDFFSTWVEHFGSEKRAGTDFDSMEVMALSAYALEDGRVHLTYMTCDRGTEDTVLVTQFLDRAPRGREDGKYPGWPRKRDEYATSAA